MLLQSIEMRPSQYRAWGILASVYQNQHADEAKVRETYLKAIALAADLRKETPRDSYLLADVGSYYAAVGMEKESLPLLAQAAALAPDVPEGASPPRGGLAVACKGESGWLSFPSHCAESPIVRPSG